MSRPPAEETAALLSIAQSVLKDTVLPAVPADRRFPALMVANALGIAARAVAAGPGTADEALADLVAAAGGTAGGDPGRALAGLIRAGAFDPGTARHDALRRALTAAVADRLAVSNPKVPPPPP